MLYRCAVALALLGPVLPASAAEPEGAPEEVYPGITYTRWRDASGPVRLHVASFYEDVDGTRVSLSRAEDVVAGLKEQVLGAVRGAVPLGLAIVASLLRPRRARRAASRSR